MHQTKANTNFFTFSTIKYITLKTNIMFFILYRAFLHPLLTYNVHISLLCTLKIHFSCKKKIQQKKPTKLKMYEKLHSFSSIQISKKKIYKIVLHFVCFLIWRLKLIKHFIKRVRRPDDDRYKSINHFIASNEEKSTYMLHGYLL